MDSNLLTAVITGITTGGLLTGAATLYGARRKVPAERDSIIVTGAETAVLSIEKVVAAESRRADRAEALVAQRDAEIRRKDARIEALERRLDEFQDALDATRAELHAIRTTP